MRVAVIGCGSIGRRHIDNLLALGCEVIAHDTDASVILRADWPADCEFSKTWDVGTTDAVVIATPYDQHLYYVEKAIARQIPFFVEKPLGSLDQLPRWREIAAMDLPVNQVGYMLRFHPDVTWLRSAFTPRSVYLHVRWNASKYASALLESSHELDLLGVLLGHIPPVRGVRVDDDIEIVFSDDSVVVINGRSDYLRTWTVSDGRRTAYVQFQSPDELGTEMYRAELAHFLDCVRDQKPTICQLAYGLKVLEVCDAVETMTRQAA